jgi:beta-lactamase regulating signal transducer with metallopeptidase domain
MTENAFAALAVKATLAMLASLLLIRLARGASAALRHLVAAATFGVLLLLPAAAMVVPPRVIEVTRLAAPPPVAASRTLGSSDAARRPETGVPSLPSSGLRRADVMEGALAIYALGLAGLLASLLVGIFRLYGVRARAEVSVTGTRLANEMARAEGRGPGIEVAVSSALAVPITFGWTHPVILLPEETAEWDEQALGRALRHELEHITRADWATHVVSRIALALYWPHPFAWLLWRRLRLDAERACDDAVLRSHSQAEPYAEQLVSLARRLSGRGTVPALSMATRSNLGLRVEAILDGRRRRSPRSRFASIAVGVAAAAGAIAIAPIQVMGALAPPVNESAAADDRDDEADPLDMALLESAEKGDLRRMQRLLGRGARANAVIDGDGSPLIAAARRGRVEAMKVLITAGADVNRGVGGDGNPLIMAAKGGHLDAVRLLLDHGADIDLGVPGDGNALIMAAGEGQIETVRFLLDTGASLEKVVPGDENPLIHACEGGAGEVVRLLIERGADVNARVWAEGSNEGHGEWRTPLVMARRNGHLDVVETLLAAGARE